MKCACCHKSIYKIEPSEHVNGKTYHRACFTHIGRLTCSKCGRTGYTSHCSPQNALLLGHGSELFCPACYALEYASGKPTKDINSAVIDVSDHSDSETEDQSDNININATIPPSDIPPVDNINLCFVGGVSTGKSTILNAIFCEELTQCKIKRTTMVPTVYIENATGSSKIVSPEEIYTQIAQKNAEIIEKTERGAKIDQSDYAEKQFNVGKLDINILPDCFVNVYDIPGLNDARTKSVYYDYLEKSFHKFNLVVFLVDIHSGLNTSDEIDIVNFITTHTLHQKQKNNKNIFTLVVVNKADDMQWNDETANLELTGELSEMYEQVENTVSTEFERKGIVDHLIGIIPLCAIDAYLYRMVKLHGSAFQLSKEQILKIGVNENGKKFSTYKPAVQEEKVRKILEDETFINTMISLSGFAKFEKILSEFLNKNGVSKEIRIENLNYELGKLPTTDFIRTIKPHQAYAKSLELSILVEKYVALFKKIRAVCEETYNNKTRQMIELLTGHLQHIILNNYPKHEYTSIIEFYKNFHKDILIRYFGEEWVGKEVVYDTYLSNYLVANVVDYLSGKFTGYVGTSRDSTAVYTTIGVLETGLKVADTVGVLNSNTCQIFMEAIIGNVKELKTIAWKSDKQDVQSVLNCLKKCVSVCENRQINVKFMRFIILNYITDVKVCPRAKLVQKQMIYKQHGEVAILTYIENEIRPTGVSFKDYLVGECDPDDHLLDMFYLNYIQQSTSSSQP